MNRLALWGSRAGCAFALVCSAFSQTASAGPVIALPNLTDIVFHEVTGDVDAYTFSKTDPRLQQRLADPLGTANSDFAGTTSEFYDVFYSDADGTFNVNGEYLTIEGVYLNPAPAGGALNLSEIELKFGSLTSELGLFVASYVGVGNNFLPATVGNAIDKNFGTWTVMGNTRDQPAGTRLRLTLGFASSVLDVDHFLSYKVTRKLPKPPKFGPVSLTDRFAGFGYDISSGSNLFLPADKNSEGLIDEITHLLSYPVALSSSSPDPVLPTNLNIRNQCEDTVIDLTKVDSILVPTAKDLVGPVSPPNPASHHVDHYLCYTVKSKVVVKARRGIQVELVEQFESRRYDLKKLVRFCTPVAKDGNPVLLSGPQQGTPKDIEPAVIQNPEVFLACYGVKIANRFIAQDGCGPASFPYIETTIVPPQEPHTARYGINTNNQFDPMIWSSKKALELCIPTVFRIPPPEG